MSLKFDSVPLFSNISFSVNSGDRICLVGRNGSGKSTLLKTIAGMEEFDNGNLFVKPGVHISYLEQNPSFQNFNTLEDFFQNDNHLLEERKLLMMIDQLKVKPDLKTSIASGGELRRAALVKSLSNDSELLLLDEPTNHLDLDSIEWLENYLSQTKKAFILISHDRQFLSSLSKKTFWVDRGRCRLLDKGFVFFEDWRDKIFEDEMIVQKKLRDKIKTEAHWAVEGISARRKRNQGRLRNLDLLREQSSNYLGQIGKAKMALELGNNSGKLVIEASNISKSFGRTSVVENFSLKVAKGDRIALVGGNGVGKTTLMNLLLGRVEPDAGTVKLGTNLELAYFDQNRSNLRLDISPHDMVTRDPELGDSGKNDQIMVRGKPRNAVSYLKEFLFDEGQLYGKISDLSGGEQARLLLSILMARKSNLLILDEPTNDLDIETLDLLKEIIGTYDGTVLFISHDRDFVDSLATKTLIMRENADVIIQIGGYADYRRNSAKVLDNTKVGKKYRNLSKKLISKPETKIMQPKSRNSSRLSFLSKEIDKITYEISKLEKFLSDPNLFNDSQEKYHKAVKSLSVRKDNLSRLENEWLEIQYK